MDTEGNSVVIYKSSDGIAQLEVKLKQDTVWLTLNQVSELFDRDKSVVSRHINGVFNEGELNRSSTVAKYATVQQEGGRIITRDIDHFNLDVIISVGYRVKSQRGTQFRIWASNILKDYLIKGYVVNEKRLKEKVGQFEDLKKVVQLQEKVISTYQLEGNEATGLIKVITDYAHALDILDDFDHQRLKIPESSSKEVYQIKYDEAKMAIQKLGEQISFKGLYGKEKDDSFKGSLANIYQTFDGTDLYPTVEEKAAHLLYFVTKNHSFADGNKRIAAFLFVWFLERNGLQIKSDGSKRIPNNALVALTLMIAESNPDDKEMMIKVVVNLLAK